MLKAADESIIFDFDLHPLTQYIDIFSNSALTLDIFNQIVESKKDNKNKDQNLKISTLLPEFILELKKIEKEREEEEIKKII